MAERRDFLSQPAPANYVAGLGRGATGFTTRSDIGSMREGPSDEHMKEIIAKRSAALGIAVDGKKKDKATEEENNNDDERFQDPDNEVGLFAGGVYDQDDEEADAVYAKVDARNHKRNEARKAREEAEQKKNEQANSWIRTHFADSKRQLEGVTEEEWANLPEARDATGKNRRLKQAMHQRFYANSDFGLAAAQSAGEMSSTVVEEDEGSKMDTSDGAMTNFAKIGAARDKVLKVRLDQAGTETRIGGGVTSVDRSGYITSLNKHVLPEAQAQLGDLKRVRELLNSVIKSNPNNALGWIANARLEELAHKPVTARKIIAEACEKQPKNEDVWLENIRLNEGHNAKVIAKNATMHNSRSVRLWIEAMKLETIPSAKKRVIRQALEHIPESEILWKEAVNLEEDPADARLYLAEATKRIPKSIDLWLALARLETPANAKKVLNQARRAIPTSHEIWIAAARLTEQSGEQKKGNLMELAVKMLAKESAMPTREEWITEAEKCEDEGAIVTCGDIIQATLGFGLDEDDDRKDIWQKDATNSINRGKYQTARAIFAYALRVFVNSRTLWMAAADLERHHGDKQSLWGVLEKAVEACPKSEVLWMMLAKEKWLAGDLDGARVVLARAFKQNADNEDIWLAAVKLEAENGQEEHARSLLETAREQAPTDRVWMKSAVYERVLGNTETALNLVIQALQLFPAAGKLWMLKGQIYEDLGMIPQAREAYGTGVKAVPSAVGLWLLYSRLEETHGSIVKARSVLDRARLAVRKSAELWCESVRIERRAGNVPQAKNVMAKALQEVPKSGLLWSEQIMHLEARTQRRHMIIEAVKKVESDPILFVTAARIFWSVRDLVKAQKWFERALVVDADCGDAWAWYYKFLRQHGTEEKVGEVVSKCVGNEPRHGEVWQRVAKAPKNARKSVEEILDLVLEEPEYKGSY